MFKHRHLLRVLHFTVILLNIRAQFFLLFRICLYYQTFTSLIDTEAYSELRKTSKMEIKLLTIFGKSSILDVCLGSEHTSPTLRYAHLRCFLTKQISEINGNMQEYIALHVV